jgi:hypothetical protein
MRAKEFIVEIIIGNLTVGKVSIGVDDHSFKRVKQRGVSPKKVDIAIRKIKDNVDRLDDISAGEQFWIHDAEQDISLGMRKLNDDNKLVLKTLVNGLPYDGPLTVLEF